MIKTTAGIAAATRAIEMSENLGLNVKLAEISAKDQTSLLGKTQVFEGHEKQFPVMNL